MLTFDTENYDTDTMHSTSSNTGRLVATTAGKYIIEGQVEFAASATGVRIAQIRLNGSTIIASNRKLSLSTGVTQVGVDTVYNLAANDYVELLVNQTSLAALNADAGLGTTWFGATRQADEGATGATGSTGPTGATGAAGSPADATYITQTPNASLSAEQALSALGTGALKSTTGTGVVSLAALDDLSDVAIAAAGANQGLVYTGSGWENVDARNPMMPTGALAETFSRMSPGMTAATAGVSQRLELQAIWLPKGITITSITFLANGGSSLATGVHQLFGLYDNAAGSSSGTAWALLRGSADDTSAAWTTNTYKTLNLTSTYTTTRSGLFYLGLLVQATTLPTWAGLPSFAQAGYHIAPFLRGPSNTSVTALPNPATALSANTFAFLYAYVS